MLDKKLTDRLDENGRPVVEWVFDGSDGHEGVLLTGPVRGEVVLKDGSRYDVSPEVIEHLPGHAGPLTHHIERKLEETGQLGALRPQATHECTEACGDEAD
jgi:hypothetical protein